MLSSPSPFLLKDDDMQELFSTDPTVESAHVNNWVETSAMAMIELEGTWSKEKYQLDTVNYGPKCRSTSTSGTN